MQISISTRHGQLSDASREKIEKKAGKLLRIFDRLTSIDLTVNLEHEDMPTVDLNVSAEHKHDFVAADRSNNLMGSVDTVVHKMEQQLRKYKDKIQSHHRTTGTSRVEVAADTTTDSETEDTDLS